VIESRALPPPDAKSGRMTIDTGERVRVDEIFDVNPHLVWVFDHSETSAQWRTDYYKQQIVTDAFVRPVCEAPCTVNLPTGEHQFHLQAINDGRWANLSVVTSSTPRIYRVGLGHSVSIGQKIVMGFVDVGLLVPGMSLLAASAVDWAAISGEPTAADHDRIQHDAVGLGIAGGVVLAAGIVGAILLRPAEQETVIKVDSAAH
jgi:hypothetical protein